MKLLQPAYFDAFQCVGAACEDTCCIGWIVHVDKPTYDRYRDCSSAEPGSPLHTLVTINEKSSSDDDYAKITLTGTLCPFLSEGLCSIQKSLGEEYLPKMCATYPRIRNRVDNVVQQSLDISCPAAARLALLNPEPIEFCEEDKVVGSRLGNFPSIESSSLTKSLEPNHLVRDVQRLVISLLQDRSHPLWKRLVMLGHLCERLDETGWSNGNRETLKVLHTHLGTLDNAGGGGFGAQHSAHPTAQLEAVLELIVARISADTNPSRFLECYQEFMSGIEWTPKSTMDEIGARYVEAHSQHYVPFMSQHQFMLEHYLVSYAFRTLLPFGLPESNARLNNGRIPSAMAQYMLMTAQYSITRTLLIGMAGFHKSAFGTDHVIKLLQSCAKTFEHSVSYPGRAIELLASKAMTTATSLRVLFQE